MAGLKEWFKQDWVDIGAKKKGRQVLKNVEENLQVDQKENIQNAYPAAKASTNDRIAKGECCCNEKK